MKNDKKMKWTDVLMDVVGDVIVALLGLGVCVIALVIGACIPEKVRSVLPFEFLVFLAGVLIYGILYFTAVLLKHVKKSKKLKEDRQNEDQSSAK